MAFVPFSELCYHRVDLLYADTPLALFWKEVFATTCFDSSISKEALKLTRSVCLSLSSPQ
jgi:hypothetical protein